MQNSCTQLAIFACSAMHAAVAEEPCAIAFSQRASQHLRINHFHQHDCDSVSDKRV